VSSNVACARNNPNMDYRTRSLHRGYHTRAGRSPSNLPWARASRVGHIRRFFAINRDLPDRLALHPPEIPDN